MKAEKYFIPASGLLIEFKILHTSQIINETVEVIIEYFFRFNKLKTIENVTSKRQNPNTRLVSPGTIPCIHEPPLILIS